MNTAELIEAVEERFPEGVASSHAYRGDATVVLRADALVDVARFLREEPALAMEMLTDLTAVDWSSFGKGPAEAFLTSSGVALGPSLVIPDEQPWGGPPEGARFSLVVHLYSVTHRHRLRLSVPIEQEPPAVDTLCEVWPAANWLEREVWDMYGITFRGHPDLRKILMYDGFEGHPLRKDYPVDKRQPRAQKRD